MYDIMNDQISCDGMLDVKLRLLQKTKIHDKTKASLLTKTQRCENLKSQQFLKMQIGGVQCFVTHDEDIKP